MRLVTRIGFGVIPLSYRNVSAVGSLRLAKPKRVRQVEAVLGALTSLGRQTTVAMQLAVTALRIDERVAFPGYRSTGSRAPGATRAARTT